MRARGAFGTLAAHGAYPDVAPLGLVNGGLALGADAPVSGLTFDIPVLELISGRVTWVTGGALGPDGGIAASVALAGGLIWLGCRAARAREGDRT